MPVAEDTWPRLYVNVETTIERAYVDQTKAVGLRNGGLVHGAIASDWNYDGDLDIYLGRPVLSDKVFYRATDRDGGDGLANGWLGIRLDGTGSNNESCIGASVTASYDGKTPIQYVDGGSARGSQRGHDLIFGLGDWTGDVEIVIEWPNGYTQYETILESQLGWVHEIQDMTDPGLIDSSIVCTKRLMPGGYMKWTFKWDSAYRTPAARDTLEISGPGFGDPSVYTADPGSVTKNPDGTYAHEITFTKLCKPGVFFPYTLSSSTEVIKSESEPGKYERVPLCSSR